MSQSIFYEFNKANNDLTMPFANRNIELRQTDTYSRMTGSYPEALKNKDTLGLLKSSSTHLPDGLPFISSQNLLISDNLRKPNVNNVGLMWAIPNDLVTSYAVNEPLKSQTERMMEMNKYPDGTPKNPLTFDPEAIKRQYYADFVANVQRATLLAQDDRWAEEAEALIKSAWEELKRKDPYMYAVMRVQLQTKNVPKAPKVKTPPNPVSLPKPKPKPVSPPLPKLDDPKIQEIREGLSPRKPTLKELEALAQESVEKVGKLKATPTKEELKEKDNEDYLNWNDDLTEQRYGTNDFWKVLFKPYQNHWLAYLYSQGLEQSDAFRGFTKTDWKLFLTSIEEVGTRDGLRFFLSRINRLTEDQVEEIHRQKADDRVVRLMRYLAEL